MKVLGKRMLASVVNFFAVFMLFTLLYSFFSLSAYKNFSKKTNVEALYNEAYRQYADYKVQYGLEFLDLDGKHVVDENASDEMKIAFAEDEDVQKVYAELIEYQAILRNYLISEAAISFVICYVIVYLVFPLLTKNGCSPGMKIYGLALANKLDCQVQKKQVVVRFLVILITEGAFMTFLISTIFAPVMSSLVLLAVFGIILFANVLMVMISKRNTSLADYFTATGIVDAKDTLIFDDLAAKGKFEEEVSKI